MCCSSRSCLALEGMVQTQCLPKKQRCGPKFTDLNKPPQGLEDSWCSNLRESQSNKEENSEIPLIVLGTLNGR